MSLKQIVLWAWLGFLLLFIAFNPADAADVVRAVVHAPVDLARGLGEFFAGLTGGGQ